MLAVSASNYSEYFICNEQLQHEVLRALPFPIQNSLLSNSDRIQTEERSDPCFLTSQAEDHQRQFLRLSSHSIYLYIAGICRVLRNEGCKFLCTFLFLKDVPVCCDRPVVF